MKDYKLKQRNLRASHTLPQEGFFFFIFLWCSDSETRTQSNDQREVEESVTASDPVLGRGGWSRLAAVKGRGRVELLGVCVCVCVCVCVFVSEHDDYFKGAADNDVLAV
jgi:hypothetical protein